MVKKICSPNNIISHENIFQTNSAGLLTWKNKFKHKKWTFQQESAIYHSQSLNLLFDTEVAKIY